MVIIPNLDHMLWHIQKEDFATNFNFGRKAEARRCDRREAWQAGLGNFGHVATTDQAMPKKDGAKTSSISLRLVMEGDGTANKPHTRVSHRHRQMQHTQNRQQPLGLVLQAAPSRGSRVKHLDCGCGEPSLWCRAFSRRAALMLPTLSGGRTVFPVQCGSGWTAV